MASSRYIDGILLLGTAMVILGVNWSFGVFEPFWERLSDVRHAKQAQYEAFLASDGSPDIIVVGSSTTMMGIDAGHMSEITQTSIYNAGQLGYGPTPIAADVVQEILDAQRARMIIYAIDSFSLTVPARSRAVVDTHGRGSHFLWGFSIFRNRDVFFYWVKRLARGDWMDPRDAWANHLREGGRFLSFDGATLREKGYVSVAGVLNRDWPEYRKPLRRRDASVAALYKIAELCKAYSVPLVLVRMPEFSRTYQEYEQEHAELHTFLGRFSREHGIEFLDFGLPGAFEHANADFFFDIHHLNERGAPAFSMALAEDIRALLPPDGFDAASPQ